jgi:hypothetical protein
VAQSLLLKERGIADIAAALVLTEQSAFTRAFNMVRDLARALAGRTDRCSALARAAPRLIG